MFFSLMVGWDGQFNSYNLNPSNRLMICCLLSFSALLLNICPRVKGRYLTQSYDKSPYTHRKGRKSTWQHKTPPNTSITQRLQTDLRRAIGVTIATQLVWLNRLKGSQFSNKPQKLCYQKDTQNLNVSGKISFTLVL